MDRQFSVTVTPEIYEDCDRGRAGKILAKVCGFSRKEISRLKFQGEIFLNDRRIHVTEHIPVGETLHVRFRESQIQDYQIPFTVPRILYEDEDLVIVNKPAGMPVHASHGHLNDSMGDALCAYYRSLGKQFQVRTVGRLDRDVSGAVIYARNQPASARLWQQRQSGILRKEYIALAEGSFPEAEGEITLPLARISGFRQTAADPEGKPCITRYRQIWSGLYGTDEIALLKVEIITGRTHQIRAHMSALGHPLLGDALYGGSCSVMNRPALHCASVQGISPFTGTAFRAEAEPAEDMQQILCAVHMTEETDYE